MRSPGRALCQRFGTPESHSEGAFRGTAASALADATTRCLRDPRDAETRRGAVMATRVLVVVMNAMSLGL